MFVTPAYAQADAAAAVNPLVNFVPIVLMFVIFYFLLIRPQQQARKKHMDMIAALKRGDQVVTAGGVVGKVVKVLEGDEVQVEIADKVVVKLVKSTISTVLTKAEAPANDQ